MDQAEKEEDNESFTDVLPSPTDVQTSRCEINDNGVLMSHNDMLAPQNDVLVPSNGQDVLMSPSDVLTLQNDVLMPSNEHDVLMSSNDVMTSPIDVLVPSNGHNVLMSSNGHDVLRSSNGHDVMMSSSNHDALMASNLNGHEHVLISDNFETSSKDELTTNDVLSSDMLTSAHEVLTSSNDGLASSSTFEQPSSHDNVLLVSLGNGDTNAQQSTSLVVYSQEGCITRSRSHGSLNEGYSKVSKKVKKPFQFDDVLGPLRRSFLPLYWSLRLVGLTYSKTKSQKVTLSMLHSFSVVFMAWINVGRRIIAYTKDDRYGATLMIKIMVHIWSTQAAIGVTLFVISFRKHIPDMLTMWNKYHQEYHGISPQFIRRRVNQVIIGFWLSFVIFAALMVFAFSSHFQYLNNLVISHIFEENSVPYIIKCIYQFFNVYLTVLYMLPCVAIILFCHMMKLEFCLITSRLRCHVTSGDPVEYVEDIRQRHLAMTQILLKFDDIVSGYLLNVYALDIPMLCFNIFIFMFSNDPTDVQDPEGHNIIAQVGSFAVAMTHLSMVTIAAVSLTAAVSILHCSN